MTQLELELEREQQDIEKHLKQQNLEGVLALKVYFGPGVWAWQAHSLQQQARELMREREGVLTDEQEYGQEYRQE